ncbi:glycosyltransferase family 4 protein [Luedemannella flava]
MRIAIITESFPPDVNGVANSVVRVAEHLVARGHEPLVIAPAPGLTARGYPGAFGFPVMRVPSVPLPAYKGFRLGLPSAKLTTTLRDFAPDLVHLASPVALGARGVVLTDQLDLPTVAVYQTDLPAYARLYRLGIGEAAAWAWLRAVHNGADRTLAPSTSTADSLVAQGIRRVWLWQRGVDAVRYHPGKRSDAVRAALAPGGEIIVGYVGRLAAEKRVDLLAGVARLPGVRLVIVGDGPARKRLAKALPGARFVGERHGEQLARLYASLDVFVHTGPHETFGQTVQEASASGVPVVAPAAGGPLDLVEPGVTGELVPPGDGAALTETIARLAADPGLRAAYGAAGRTLVEGRTWAAVGDELISHYESVLAYRWGRAPAARPTSTPALAVTA